MEVHFVELVLHPGAQRIAAVEDFVPYMDDAHGVAVGKVIGNEVPETRADVKCVRIGSWAL